MRRRATRCFFFFAFVIFLYFVSTCRSMANVAQLRLHLERVTAAAARPDAPARADRDQLIQRQPTAATDHDGVRQQPTAAAAAAASVARCFVFLVAALGRVDEASDA